MKNQRDLVNFAINLVLMFLGVLFFALSFPSFIADWGWAPFAWISLVPIVLLIRRIPWWSSPLWGAVSGYLTYALFNFWLATFNPVSFVLVPSIYAAWFFMLYPLLYLADKAFPRYGWLAQFVVWSAFEVIRTKGYLGYSYGILGYSQYDWGSLISIADIFGVMGVSILVVFPSFLIGGWLLDSDFSVFRNDSGRFGRWKIPSRRWVIPAIVWFSALVLANIYGVLSRVDYKDTPLWRPALIQHNVNTWLSGVDAWGVALDSLLEESESALAGNPDVVIWSETAFVPAIEWHLKYRNDRSRVDLINKLRRFTALQDVPFLIGNNDAVMQAGKRQDYNAVLLLNGDKVMETYRKIHLVPFSEYFPYAKIFPWLMDYIQSQDTPLYVKGTESKVFDLAPWGGPKAGPLICFEDTFGYLARNSVNNGAQILINHTNDSWSSSAASAIQHQTIAVFRAVENRRSLIRSATSGITSVIDPNGKVLEKLEPYTQGHIIAEVPIYDGHQTFYTRFGDWFEKVIIVVFVATMAVAVFLCFAKRNQSLTLKTESMKSNGKK